MGKGDQKSKRGKIVNKSYGVTRSRTKKSDSTNTPTTNTENTPKTEEKKKH